jgi:hypothetical protein
MVLAHPRRSKRPKMIMPNAMSTLAENVHLGLSPFFRTAGRYLVRRDGNASYP